ncbi:MAG: lysophospholipid acyltransferase family protein [Bacillota bacterium]
MGESLYLLGKYLFKIYYFIRHRRIIEGRENIPDSGPLIVMANHQSYCDPPLLGTILNRRIYFLAKKELFDTPVFGWVLNKIGVIPIKRGKPDLKALRRSFAVLKENKVLGVFPEGTRNKPGSNRKAQPGAVLIALKSKAPILPVGIKNITKNKRTRVSIGQPFTLDDFYDRKLDSEEKKRAGKVIMDKIETEINKIAD